MTIIYALLHPDTSSPFYIGSTKKLLKERLQAHIYENKSEEFRGVKLMKQRAIIGILSEGKCPVIKRLMIVSDDKAPYFEEAVYHHYKSLGFILLQKGTSFPKPTEKMDLFEKSPLNVSINDMSAINADSIGKQIIMYLANGLTAREISKFVWLSPRTIETRIMKMKDRIGATTMSHLIAICFKIGFLH